MEVIKKVLANVVQTLTRSEQMTAKNNIGLGDSILQPPVGTPHDPHTIPAGVLVWDPNHLGAYRLLEPWPYNVPWDSITKKVRVMPGAEDDPQRIKLTIDQMNTNIPGLFYLIDTILEFGKPYIRLDLGNNTYVTFEYSEFHTAGTSSSHVFRCWQEEYTGGVATKIDFEKITVTTQNNVNFSSWSVNL